MGMGAATGREKSYHNAAQRLEKEEVKTAAAAAAAAWRIRR